MSRRPLLSVTEATYRRIDKRHDRRWHTLHANDNAEHIFLRIRDQARRDALRLARLRLQLEAGLILCSALALVDVVAAIASGRTPG